jgi:hypothetical protein
LERARPINPSRSGRWQFGSDQVDHDIDIAADGFGIGTGLMRGVCQGAGDFSLKAPQTNVETSLKEVGPVVWVLAV